MRFFYDCEFIENGVTIELVSLGVVAEDPRGGAGQEFYAVSTDFNPDHANPWVRRNVLPKLPNPADQSWRPKDRLRDDFYAFLLDNARGATIDLWAWVGAYDHVAVCQLWGDMTRLPAAMPRYTRELKQLWELAGKPALPGLAGTQAHSALADARHNAQRFAIIERALQARGIAVPG